MRRARAGSLLAWLLACGGSSAPAEPVRPDFRGGTVYEVFVRSFADADGDGIGDLRGLTAHLDYLNDGKGGAGSLGVDAVWLMPIFPSPSYHGYDVTDYRAINPRYGTLEDFDAFVAAAHQRGVRVVLDMVLNHSSSRHPWFADAQTDPSAAKRAYYVWSETDPHWTRPFGSGDPWYPLAGAYYYALFGAGLPDLNLANPAVEQELTDAMNFWLARGVDGFRLDAVRYLLEAGNGAQADQPATHAYLRRLRAALAKTAPKEILVGEAWDTLETQASYYGQGDELHLAFSFELADAVKAAARAGDASTLINVLARTESAYTGKDRAFEAPFLSNHDQVRVLRDLEGDAGAARVAAATLFALPGTPFVYYGEELGMLGGAGSDDQNKRTAFRWDATSPGHGFTAGTPWRSSDEATGVDVATEQAAPESLWHLYRSLIGVRRGQLALLSGDATRPTVGGAGTQILALLRTAPSGERVLFVANYGITPAGPFTIDAGGAPAVLVSEGLAAAPATASGKLTFTQLSARGFAFVALT